MNQSLENIITKNITSDIGSIFNEGKIGIEKESLRVRDLRISKTDHPNKLGSALCNKYITTDFSEAQLELVTPPFKDKMKALHFLENIHQFVNLNIDDEILWPFSFPPQANSEKDIRIAQYGKSNAALFKETYRKGLASRYGRRMQAISGIHINYSLPPRLLEEISIQGRQHSSSSHHSEVYFRMMRNLYRVNWLILYLFGASPILTKDHLNKQSKDFKQIDKNTFYLPYATSLRMSDLGYQNADRVKLEVSTDSIEEYISDLVDATRTEFKGYKKIGEYKSEDFCQLNSNILQIDDEFYAIARPKSSNISDMRLTSKLTHYGVDYIELRSLDLNPFNRNGLDLETIYFIELLFLHCLLKTSPKISKDEMKEIRNNESLVSRTGRKPDLNLSENQKNISLKSWALRIIEEISEIAEDMDGTKNIYSESLNNMKKKVLDPDITLSNKLLDKALTEKLGFSELGNLIGSDNKEHFLKSEKNKNWELLEKEAMSSIVDQRSLEDKDSKTFKEYLGDYSSS